MAMRASLAHRRCPAIFLLRFQCLGIAQHISKWKEKREGKKRNPSERLPSICNEVAKPFSGGSWLSILHSRRFFYQVYEVKEFQASLHAQYYGSGLYSKVAKCSGAVGVFAEWCFWRCMLECEHRFLSGSQCRCEPERKSQLLPKCYFETEMLKLFIITELLALLPDHQMCWKSSCNWELLVPNNYKKQKLSKQPKIPNIKRSKKS